MNKPGRNDPCPCGSGKKYKQCCLRRQDAETPDERSAAVPRAIKWLMAIHGPAVREALDEGFFGGLDDEEHERLQSLDEESYRGIMVNAMEWLLAHGTLNVKGRERPTAELLLGRGGPLFSAPQRQWIESLAARPLRLYEVIAVVPGESLLLKDVLLPEGPPVLVSEKAGSEHASQYDLLAARLMPVEGHVELSGAVYSIPRLRAGDLIAELREELTGLEPDSPVARQLLATIIPDYWLTLLLTPFTMPTVVDQLTGEPLLLITDHYRVQDWEALEQAREAA